MRTQRLDKRTSYSEEEHGICIVHQDQFVGGFCVHTTNIKIPWRMLRASLRRKDLAEFLRLKVALDARD
jgi:hypothetical protein